MAPATPKTQEESRTTLNDKERKIYEKNLEMLISECQMGESIGGKYYSYLYTCLNFTLFFYGALIAIFHGTTNLSDVDPIILFWLFKYLLPISTYVLGLFYAYNTVVILKHGYYMIRIEQDIIKLCNNLGYPYSLHGWDLLSNKKLSGFIYPYGTMLMFYFLLPLGSLILSTSINSPSIIFNAFGLDITPILVTWIPCLCLVAYYIFMGILIRRMFIFSFFNSLFNNDVNRVNLDNKEKELNPWMKKKKSKK